jgi:hypothetical protein
MKFLPKFVLVLVSIFFQIIFHGVNGKKTVYIETLIEPEVGAPYSAWANSNGDVYITDPSRYRIIKTDSNNTVTVVAGLGYLSYEYVYSYYGMESAANLKSYQLPVMYPRIIRGDSRGNIYFSDDGFHKINKISPELHLETIAGTIYGTGVSCGTPQAGMIAAGTAICYPYSLHVDDLSQDVYFSEKSTCKIFRIEHSSGMLKHVAGQSCSYYDSSVVFNIPAINAQWYIENIWANSAGDVYATVPAAGKVAKISYSDGLLYNYAGNNYGWASYEGSWANSTYLSYPVAVTGDDDGNIFVYGSSYCRIRKIAANGWTTHFAGTYCYVSVADGGYASSTSIVYLNDISMDFNRNMYLPEESHSNVQIIRSNGKLESIIQVLLSGPCGLWKDADGNIFIADYGNNRIAVYSNGIVRSLLGTAEYRPFEIGKNITFADTYLKYPESVFGDNEGNLFIGDQDANMIYVADLANETVKVVAGMYYNYGYSDDGQDSRFGYLDSPRSVTLFKDEVYFLEYSRCLIRKFPKFGGPIKTVAGDINLSCGYFQVEGFIDQGANQQLTYMDTIWVNSMGDIFAAMKNGNRVVKISTTTNRVVTFAGTGNYGHDANWFANESIITYPSAICGDHLGNVFIFSTYSNRIQQVTEDGYLMDFAGNGRYDSPRAGPASESPLTVGYSLLCGDEGLEYVALKDRNILAHFYDHFDEDTIIVSNGLNMTTVVENSIIEPSSVWEDGNGNLYIADGQKYQILKLDTAGKRTVVAGVGYYSTEYIYNSDSRKIETLKSYELPIGWINSVRGDSAGNIYFTDGSFHKLNKVSPALKLRTLTGTPYGRSPQCNYYYDGNRASDTSICYFGGLHIDNDSGDIYFTERNFCRVVRIVKVTGLLQIIAGSGCSYYSYEDTFFEGADPRYLQFYPFGVWVDSNRDVFFTTTYQKLVLKVIVNETKTTIYGGCGDNQNAKVMPWEDGLAQEIYLDYPSGIGGDSSGNVYVTTNDCRIRRISTNGEITRLAGTGSCSSGPNNVNALRSRISWLDDIYVKSDGSMVLAEYDSGYIRKIDTDNIISLTHEANLKYPMDIWVDQQGSMYVASYNYVVKFDIYGKKEIVIGDVENENDGIMENISLEEFYFYENRTLPIKSVSLETKLSCPSGIVGDNNGHIFVVDNCFSQIYVADLYTMETTVIGGFNRQDGYSEDGAISFVTYLGGPWGIALYEDDVYFSEWSYCRIRKFSKVGGPLITIAGNGGCIRDEYFDFGLLSPFQMLSYPMRLWINDYGEVFFTSSNIHAVFRISSNFQNMTIVVGNGMTGYSTNSPALSSSLSSPTGICADETNDLYVYEWGNYIVQKVTADNVLVDVAGNRENHDIALFGNALSLSTGGGYAIECKGKSIVYILDYDNMAIRIVHPSNLSVERIPSTFSSDPPTFSPTFVVTTPPTVEPTFEPSVSPTFEPTANPTFSPTTIPSFLPSTGPTQLPSQVPSVIPSEIPSVTPTTIPSLIPSVVPSVVPSEIPTVIPSNSPTFLPSLLPSEEPSLAPSHFPSVIPSQVPSEGPSEIHSVVPTFVPTCSPSFVPSSDPTSLPTEVPTAEPTISPTFVPSYNPTVDPTMIPSAIPSESPSRTPTAVPTLDPSYAPSQVPSQSPTMLPTSIPSFAPTEIPTVAPTLAPTLNPTVEPSVFPSLQPSIDPSYASSQAPSQPPSMLPTSIPSFAPSEISTMSPTESPSIEPTYAPSMVPSVPPTVVPTALPTVTSTLSYSPSQVPAISPSKQPNSGAIVATLSPTLSEDENWRESITSAISSFAITASQTSLDADFMRSASFYEASTAISGLSTGIRGGCSAWNSFVFVNLPSLLISLKASYIRIGVMTSLSHVAVATCSRSAKAVEIIRALIKGVNASITCDNTIWKVGTCGSSMSICANCSSHCGSVEHSAFAISSCSNGLISKSFRMIDVGLYPPSPAPPVISIRTQVNRTSAIVSVHTASKAKVYVGIFTAAKSAPTSTEVVKFQNWQSSQSDVGNVTSILIGGLIPATNYVIFAVTESLKSGVSSSHSTMLSTATNFRTACCKEVSVTLASTSVLQGSSYASILRVSLDSLPSRNLTGSVSLINVNGESQSNAFVPSLLTWTPVAQRSRSVSLAESIPAGSYAIKLKLFGDDSIDYSLSSSLSLQILDAESSLPPPVATSVSYSSDGSYALIQFSSQSNFGGLPPSFVCSRLFSFICAGVSTCSWIDSMTVRADVATFDTCMKPGDIVSVLPRNELRAACPVGRVCSSQRLWSTSPSANITVSAPQVALSPDVYISAPAIIGNGSSYILDVSASAGNGGRSWRSFAIDVSVLESGDGQITNSSNLRSYIQRTFKFSPPTKIGSEYFQPGQSYLFTISLCNFLFQCGSASTTVTVVDAVIPTVSIAGNRVLEITTSNGLMLAGDARAASSRSSSAVGLSTSWAVYLDGVPTDISSTSRNPYNFGVAPYALQTGKVYEIVFSAVIAGGKSASCSVQVIVKTGELKAVIAGSNQRSVRIQESLVLDGSSSKDEDLAPASALSLSYTWKCSQSFPVLSDNCDSIVDLNDFASSMFSSKLVLKPVASASQAVMEIALIVADIAQLRTASTSVTVTVLPILSPLISIESLVGSGKRQINPSDELQLLAKVGIPSTAIGNISWSMDSTSGLTLSNLISTPLTQTWNAKNDVQIVTSYLRLLPNSLSAGVTYNFILTGFLRSPGVTAALSIAIEVNRPPQPGNCDVYPKEGFGLTDIYSFSCSNWVDVDLPILYEFSYRTESGTNLVVKSASKTSFRDLVLPMGSKDSNYSVLCLADIIDDFNAVSSMSMSVTVLPLPSFSTEQQLQMASTILNTDAGENPDDIKQSTGVISYLLNVVNCTVTPNCATLNRQGCANVDHTCGPCLSDDYIGREGDANELCVPQADRRRLEVSDSILKSCAGNCSGHGSCQFKSRLTKKIIAACFENDFECTAECDCEPNYAGSASCSVSLETWEAKMQYRESLLDRVALLLQLEDVSKQSMKSIIDYIRVVAQNPYELSDYSKSKAITMIKEILNNAESYGISFNDVSVLFSVLNALADSIALDSVSTSNSSVVRRLRQSRRLLGSSDSVFDGFMSSLSQFGSLISNQSLPGQTLASTVFSNYRLSSGAFASNCDRNESIVLPMTGLEQFLGVTANQFQIPLCTVNESALRMTVITMIPTLLGLDAVFDSDVMSLSLSSVPCMSDNCRTTFVLSRNQGFLLQNTSQVSPLEFTTHCKDGITELVRHSCGESGNDIVVQCNGTAVDVTSRCDLVIEAPTCMAALNPTAYDSPTSNHINATLLCDTIAVNANNITCSCMLTPNTTATGTTNSVPTANCGSEDTSVSTKVSVNYMSLIKATSQNFVTTVRSAQGLNAATVKRSSTAFLLVGLVVTAVFGAISYAQHLDRLSTKVQMKDDKSNQQELVPNKRRYLVSYISNALDAPNKRAAAIAEALVAGKAGRRRAQNSDGKPMILEMAQEALPSILSSKSITTKVRDEVKRHHRWIGVVFYYSEQFPRSLRVLSLATNMTIMLFMQSLTYNLTNSSDSACSYYTNELDCLAKKSAYQTGASMCAWEVDTSSSTAPSSTGECVLIQPDNKMQIVLFVAIFSALVSTPIAFFAEWIISNVLCAPTSLQSRLRRLNKVDDSSATTVPEKTNIDPDANQSDQETNLGRHSASSLSWNRKGVAKVGQEYRALSKELYSYYNSLIVPEEKSEFREIWGLDENGRLPELSTSILTRIHVKMTIDDASSSQKLALERPMKSWLSRCWKSDKNNNQLVSDLIFFELQALREQLRKEEKLLKLQVRSNRELNKHLLYLFQRDLLPGLQGEILDDKFRRDGDCAAKPRSAFMKRVGWLFLCILNLSMLFYVLLFAAQQDPHRQRAWAQSFGIWLVMEICLTSTMTVMIKHVLVPIMLMKDISKIQHKLAENIVSFYRQMAQQKHLSASTVKAPAAAVAAMKSDEQIRSAESTDPSLEASPKPFNAASYLFLSYKVAQYVKNSTVAKIILNYSTPWPKQTYRHKVSVENNYNHKFSAISRSLSIVALYFLSNLIVVPVSVRDMVVHMITTATAGYTILIHLQLYHIYPVLIIVPTLCLGAIVHFVIKSQAGQRMIERSKLMQRIMDAGGVLTNSKTSPDEADGEADAVVDTVAVEKAPSVRFPTSMPHPLPEESKIEPAIVSSKTVVVVNAVGSKEEEDSSNNDDDELSLPVRFSPTILRQRDRRQLVQTGLQLTAAMHAAILQEQNVAAQAINERRNAAVDEYDEEEDDEDENACYDDDFRAYLQAMEAEEASDDLLLYDPNDPWNSVADDEELGYDDEYLPTTKQDCHLYGLSNIIQNPVLLSSSELCGEVKLDQKVDSLLFSLHLPSPTGGTEYNNGTMMDDEINDCDDSFEPVDYQQVRDMLGETEAFWSSTSDFSSSTSSISNGLLSPIQPLPWVRTMSTIASETEACSTHQDPSRSLVDGWQSSPASAAAGNDVDDDNEGSWELSDD